jgi:hypothetical protein
MTTCLLEEEHKLVARAVVVAHSDLLLVPDERLPETEPGALAYRLRHKHRFLITEQVKMRVAT